MRLVDAARAALAADPNVQAETLAERLGEPLSSVAPALRAARFWTLEQREKAAERTKNRPRMTDEEMGYGPAVHRALKEGRLVKPSACSACGAEAKYIDGHHHDYDKPLEVIWLCRSCHSAADRLRQDGEPYNAIVVRILGRYKILRRRTVNRS